MICNKLRMKVLMLCLSAGMFLMSCEALFTTNLFAGLDELDLSGMSTAEKADALLDDTEGALDGLSDTEVDELKADLKDLYEDTTKSDYTRKQAAAAAAAVELSESGANDTINNLSGLANDMINDDLTVDAPADILERIFSDDSGNPLSAAEIEEQLSSMIASAAALEAYGDILGSGGTAPEGVSADSLAVTTLVVGFVDYLVNTAGADVADIASDIAGGTTTTLSSLPDMSSVGDDPSSLFGANNGMINIVESSGLYSSLMDLM